MGEKVKTSFLGKAEAPGILLVGLIAAAALGLREAASRFSLPLSVMILAIILGLLVGNGVKLAPRFGPGVRFASKTLLRLAIVFLGFRLSTAQVLSLGLPVLLVMIVGSSATLLLALGLGQVLGLPKKRALLVGGGVAICGAAAVAAINAVVEAPEEDVGLAVGIITLLGTLALVAYPLVFTLLALTVPAYAVWTGASVHEVAQVTAAAAVAGTGALVVASTVKMVRVLFIVPLTLGLSLVKGRKALEGTSAQGKTQISIPWFALAFFLVVVFHSLVPLPQALVQGINFADDALMALAMAGLGLGISLRSLVKSGGKALVLGIITTLFLSGFAGLAVGFLFK